MQNSLRSTNTTSISDVTVRYTDQHDTSKRRLRRSSVANCRQLSPTITNCRQMVLSDGVHVVQTRLSDGVCVVQTGLSDGVRVVQTVLSDCVHVVQTVLSDGVHVVVPRWFLTLERLRLHRQRLAPRLDRDHVPKALADLIRSLQVLLLFGIPRGDARQ